MFCFEQADPCVATSRGGKTALHRAAVAGLPETCELLVSKAAAALETSDSAGQTALFTQLTMDAWTL
jgi:ankyrin repeat protein